MVFLALALVSARAADSWHLLIEPKFLRYQAAWPIPGSDRTVLVPARVVDDEILPLKRDEVLVLGATRTKILADAPKTASAVLATLKPRYERDDKNVIQYAILESDNPLTASAVLAPEFAAMFAETLGPDLLVAIPNRKVVFVFPKQSPAFQSVADLIFAEYQSSPNPVSREVFELKRGKLIAIGTYR